MPVGPDVIVSCGGPHLVVFPDAGHGEGVGVIPEGGCWRRVEGASDLPATSEVVITVAVPELQMKFVSGRRDRQCEEGNIERKGLPSRRSHNP